MDLAEWSIVGQRLGVVGRSSQWWIGDWISYGNAKFGEKYSRAKKITGYDSKTLMNMVYVASHFEISRRRESLSWSHHETVASLEPAEQDRWLDEALAHKWSVSDLRVTLRASRDPIASDSEQDQSANRPRAIGYAGAYGRAAAEPSTWDGRGSPPRDTGVSGETSVAISQATVTVTCPHCGGEVTAPASGTGEPGVGTPCA